MERVAGPEVAQNEPVSTQKAIAEYLADEEARKVGPERRENHRQVRRSPATNGDGIYKSKSAQIKWELQR